MKTEFPLCQSGIVFPLMSRVSVDLATALLAEVFARRGDAVDITRDGAEILFQTPAVTLRMNLTEDRARLRLTRPAEAAQLTEASAQALLAALTAALVRGFAAETVLWLRKDAVLPAARFLAAVDPVRPRRVQVPTAQHRARAARHGSARSDAWAADFEADQQTALAHLMREAEAEERAEVALAHPTLAVRLTAAVVTLFVALFSLPLAASLLVWNTLRGSDLRVSTTMLTALAFVTLIGQVVVPEIAEAMVMAPVTRGL